MKPSDDPFTLFAQRETARLLEAGLRPFPDGHDIPGGLMLPIVARTMGAYEGEPRQGRAGQLEPTLQFWYPQWVDVVVELWTGPVHLEGGKRLAQRNDVLWLLLMNPHLQRRAVDALKLGGLKEVREALLPIIKGAPPYLIEEAEHGPVRAL